MGRRGWIGIAVLATLALALAFKPHHQPSEPNEISQSLSMTATAAQDSIQPQATQIKTHQPQMERKVAVHQIKNPPAEVSEANQDRSSESETIADKSRRQDLFPTDSEWSQIELNFVAQGMHQGCFDESCLWDWRQGALLMGVMLPMNGISVAAQDMHWGRGITAFGEPALAWRDR